MPTVLIVDDQRATRRVLASRLTAAGLDVLQAADGLEAWDLFQRREPQLVVTDMAMPRSDGIDLTGRIRERSDVPIIVFSAYASVPTAVSAVRAGASEFVSSSDLDIDALVKLARDLCSRAAEHQELADLAIRLQGSSSAIDKVRGRLVALAPLRVPVLLSGEPGVGRATAARALHDLGQTSGLDFYKIEAARFQPSMPTPKHGTVFLRGIEQLSPGGREFWARRLAGMSEGQPLRIVASSACSPHAWKAEANFLPEVMSELFRFQVMIPPLRQRPQDIPDIAEMMLSRISGRLGRPTARLTEAAADRLSGQKWPGNGTELARLLERAVAYSRMRELSEEVIEDLLWDSDESLAGVRKERESREREDLVVALRETGGNIAQTAGRLGLSRPSVYRLLQKYEIPLSRARR